MANAKPLPPVDYLRECLGYEPETGELCWKVRPLAHFPSVSYMQRWNNRYAGVIAGCAIETGYFVVRVGGVNYMAHRLVWVLHHGKDLDAGVEIDHINGVGADNRAVNLRLASVTENSHNARNKSTTGQRKGVYLLKGTRARPWNARIRVGGERRSLGCFRTEAEAHTAYCVAADMFFGEFANYG